LKATKALEVEGVRKELYEAFKKVLKDIKKREAQDKVRREILAAGMMTPEASVAQAAVVESDKRAKSKMKS